MHFLFIPFFSYGYSGVVVYAAHVTAIFAIFVRNNMRRERFFFFFFIKIDLVHRRLRRVGASVR